MTLSQTLPMSARPAWHRKYLWSLLLLSPALLYLAAIYAYPVLRVMLLSIYDDGFTLKHYQHLFAVKVYRSVIINTLVISASTALGCLLLAYPTAYVLLRAPERLSKILIACVMLPFFTSILVRNYAWIFLLGSQGVVNTTLIRIGVISEPLPLMFNRAGVLIGMINVLLPYTILILLSVMRGIKRNLTPAAESLMASPFTAFCRVFLPLSLPGVIASFLLVFVLSLAFFITPAMLGGLGDTMISNIISNVTAMLNWGFAAALATVLLVASLVVITMMQYFFGGLGLLAGGDAVSLKPLRIGIGRNGALVRALDKIISPVWPYLFPAIAGLTFVYLILPVVMMIPLSFSSTAYFAFPPPGYSLQWYEKYLNSPVWLEATWHSLEVGVLTTLLSLAFAIPAAIGINRAGSSLRTLAYLFILSPLIMPTIVIAVGVFYILNQVGLNYTILGVVIGHTILALPIAMVVLTAALKNFDRSWERASISLGASPFRTLRRVTLPILSTAVVTAGLFAFLQSFDELLIALFVSGIEAGTLPKRMWESLQELDPIIAAVSTLLVCFAVAILMLVYLLDRLHRRRMGVSGEVRTV
jgi:putative spermidine/putrescine transport system permease protein